MPTIFTQARSILRTSLLWSLVFFGPALSYAQCVPELSSPSYYIIAELTAGRNGPEGVVIYSDEGDSVTTFSADTGVAHISQAVASIDLSVGEIRSVVSSGDFQIDPYAQATANLSWSDRVCFDLPDGVPEADIQIILDVVGTMNCSGGGFSCIRNLNPISFNFSTSSLNVTAEDLNLPVDQLVIDHTIAEGSTYQIKVAHQVTVVGKGIIDFSDTLRLSMTLPDGVSFQSASGVLLSNIDSDGDGTIDSSDLDDDNDGIADSLDTKPLVANNDCTTNDGANATLVSVQVIDDQTCAARESVSVSGDNGALDTVVFGPNGNLRVISERATFEDTNVETDGRLTVINADPCPGCSPLPPSFAIGDTGPAGGLVFHVTNGGLHGLEAATVDLGPAEWGCIGTDIVSAGGTAVGTGALNTAAILYACDTPGIVARVADSYSLDGFDDWFLPSRFELDLMYVNLKLAGLGDLSGLYWSSSQVDADNAAAVDLDDGTGLVGEKSGPLRLRPIRAF